MILLPRVPDPVAAATARPSRPAPQPSTVRVLVLGFSPAECELIQGIVALSQRRALRLELVCGAATRADVILLDGEDAKVMAWVGKAGLPASRAVIQVGGHKAPAGAIHLQRPIQWPSLPALLQQALGPDTPLSARQPLTPQ